MWDFLSIPHHCEYTLQASPGGLLSAQLCVAMAKLAWVIPLLSVALPLTPTLLFRHGRYGLPQLGDSAVHVASL